MGMIIGMDPHKRSATIEVVDQRAQVCEVGRYGTDRLGYADMLAAGRKYPDRVWAIEGCNGIGKHIAHRLVHDGETVVMSVHDTVGLQLVRGRAQTCMGRWAPWQTDLPPR